MRLRVFSNYFNTNDDLPRMAPRVRLENIMAYDIIGSLPLELVIYIAEHLDLEDIVRSKSVYGDHFLIFKGYVP